MRQTWAALAALLVAIPTAAFGQANCRNPAPFEPWLADFKKEAAAKGISQATIAAASPYLVLDQRIINIDRGQRFFAQNFLEMSDKMLAGGRLPNGAAQIKKHQATFAREEKDFGVPASVITAFWGWKAISVPARARIRRSNRLPPSPMTAAVRRCSAGICSMRCA